MFSKVNKGSAGLVYGASLLALTATAASAGGVAPIVEVPAAPVIVEESTYDWTGPYVGASLGYGFRGDDEVGVKTPTGRLIEAGTLEESGGMFGLRLGFSKEYTVRNRNFVGAIEIFSDGASLSDEFTGVNGVSASSDITAIGGIRVRNGVLNAERNTLFYGSAGIVAGAADYKVSAIDGSTVASLAVENEELTGFTVGLGVERKLTESLSVFGEINRTQFESVDQKFVGYSTKETPKFTDVKIGVNYNF